MIKLFKKIFNPFNKYEYDYLDDRVVEKGETGKKAVTDLFRMDLNNLPLHQFTEGKVEINANGDIIQNFFKELDYKECGIFDTVHVKLTGSRSINIIFRSSEPELVDNGKLHAMIDSIYEIYGQDNDQQGLYNSTPKVSEHQFYVLFGRNWMDYPKYRYPVSVRRYSEDVFVSIWGIRHPEVATG